MADMEPLRVPSGSLYPRSCALLLIGVFVFSLAKGEAQVTDLAGVKEIQVKHLITLGDDDGPGILGDVWDIERRRNGDWIVADYYSPQRLRIFSPEGIWKRATGRTGEGPGEIEIPGQLIVTEDDGLVVVDGGIYRVTWLGPDLEPLETTRFSQILTAFCLLPEKEFVLATQGSTTGLLQRGSASDPKLVPIEPLGTDPPRRGSPQRLRVLPKQAGGSFWSAHMVEYTLERWNVEGELLQRIEFKPEWFEPHDRIGQKPKEEGPPNPAIRAIYEDENGLVWVGIHVPDPEWEEAFGAGRDPYGRPMERVQDPQAYWDTLLQVIAPETQTVVASVRLDEPIKAFTTEGLFFSLGFSETGGPVVHVFEVTIPR